MGYYDGSRIFVPGENLDCLEVDATSDWQSDTEILRFWYPHICPRFSSPLVASENLAISGDAGWERTAKRVAAGLKPIGFVDGPTEDMAQAAKLVEAAGGYARRSPNEYHVYDAEFCTLVINGKIGEVFDIEALVADYQDYLAASPPLASQVKDELMRLAPLCFSDFFEFGDVEVDFADHLVRYAGSLARCGLLLGYPVESTVALILADHALPGGYTRY